MRTGTTPEDRRLAEKLEAIAAGDQAFAALKRVMLKRDWSNIGSFNQCALCRMEVRHTRNLHTALLPYTKRKLNRHYKHSAIGRAEKAYRKATGRGGSIEQILERELVTKHPPTAFYVLSGWCGVNAQTVLRWALILGIDTTHVTWGRGPLSWGKPPLLER